ncbi:MAG: DUF1003 domain-containing protein [Gemmatimonadales bacterium]
MSKVGSRVERNIRALVERRAAEERRKPLQDRIADRVTRFTGSMVFVCLHLVLFGVWVAVNLGWLPGPRFDPDFVKLATFASVEAIFLATFVLISQNRMAALAEERAELHLHTSLLAEHEVTHVLTLVTALAEKMGIEDAQNPELEELAREVRPEAVLEHMDEMHRP